RADDFTEEIEPMQALHSVQPSLAFTNHRAVAPARVETPAQNGDTFQPADDQQPPAPPPPPANISHYYYSQDSLAEQLKTDQFSAEGVEAGPSNARIRVSDSDHETAAPDEQGNMLYLPNDPRFNQVQTFVAVNRANSYFSEMLGREPEWAFGSPQLTINPFGGDMLNAYYSRSDGSLNFFQHTDPRMNKTVDSGLSAEVVYHEAGHALLDAVRPGWISSYRGATGGIHEGFGDMLSVLVGLRDERNLDKVIAETGGDLWKDNSVSRLAEELGRAIWDETGTERPNHDYLRNARNHLINADPSTLPWRPPAEDQLGAEPHNYSRVASGAVYDVLASLNQQFQAQGFGVRESIEKARDITAKLEIKGFEFCPPGSLPSYGHFAAGMLAVDASEFGGKYHDTVANMMAARNIIPPAPEPPPQGIALPENVNAASAQALLEDKREALGVPAGLNLAVDKIKTNDEGQTFVTYTYTKDIDVAEASGVENAVVKEQGGLTLAFDADGKLFFKTLNEIKPQDEAEIRESVKKNVEEGAIHTHSIFNSLPGASKLFKNQHVPFRGYMANENGQVVLKKSPIID
ncbi:MAG: hypothetical protein KC910_14940, partial [Candidatus Eremiobacteraeota bacterium]|nr:hypothetical protein [Candidatus Eremiobacteraeota bacterium]